MQQRSAKDPCAAYATDDGSPLRADASLYGPIGRETGVRELVEQRLIPVRSGSAWKVPAGHVCRLSIIEGPQVVDLNLWSFDDPRERFWSGRTRQFHGAHVSVGDRLWSTLPFLRPLATVVADSIVYGIDEDGAGCHDLLGTRCDPYVNQMLSGKAYDFNCHSNLVRAILPFGLTELDVHDVLNVFQVTGLRRTDERYFMKASPAKVGDHFELFAEVDLLLAASTCPGGDLSVPLWGPGAGQEPLCHPIGVEVYRLDQRLLEGWRPPQRATYGGATGLRHGLREPEAHPPLTASFTTEPLLSPEAASPARPVPSAPSTVTAERM
jgi:uncharacterized protein YcgI (DUF1989 family)